MPVNVRIINNTVGGISNAGAADPALSFASSVPVRDPIQQYSEPVSDAGGPDITNRIGNNSSTSSSGAMNRFKA